MDERTAQTRLREARLERGLSQESVARKLDCSLSWYIRVENGAQPNVDLAVAIEREFGIPVETWASRSQSEAVA